MIHIPFLLQMNSPSVISSLEEKGFKQSELCNEGKYILVEKGIIMQVNHITYKPHIDFESNPESFISHAMNVVKKNIL